MARGATGRASSATRGVGRRIGKFDPNQLRGRNGRWLDDGVDNDKPTTRNNSDQPDSVRRARAEILAALDREQRGRLVNIYRLGLSTPKGTDTTTTQDSPGSAKLLGNGTDKPPKRKRLPTARYVVSVDSLSLREGKVFVWDNLPESKQYKNGFKARVDKQHQYSVEYNGNELVLSRNRNEYKYLGETVQGVPSLSPRLRSDSNEKVIRDLAKVMSQVEGWDTKGEKPTAPEWKPALHGSIDDKSLVRSREGIGKYGGMQIHHVDQWLKGSLDKIVKEYEAGAIDLDTAKSQTSELMNKVTIQAKKGEKSDYEIDVLPSSERKFVILAGGLHDINSPLYYANHPMGIDVDSPTFKLRKYGIPKTGDGSREWFDSQFRPGFWAEVYRRETYVLSGEVNRRLRKGEITEDEVRELWTKAKDGLDKQRDAILELRKEQVN